VDPVDPDPVDPDPVDPDPDSAPDPQHWEEPRPGNGCQKLDLKVLSSEMDPAESSLIP
jgi:hypothetical protein